MSRFFVCLNNWNSFDWRSEMVGKHGWHRRRFGWASCQNEERSFNKIATTLQYMLQNSHCVLKPRAPLYHNGCATVNQELLCLKLPSACLPVVYMRVFTHWSGFSHLSSTMSKRASPSFGPCERYIQAYLPSHSICLFLFLMMGYFWAVPGSWWVILKSLPTPCSF